MPRAIWSGSISFGLVNIPVQLFNAVSRKQVRFNQIDSRNNARIRMKKTNAESGEDVPDEVIVKGYELSKGNYVLLSEDELAALDPEGPTDHRHRGVRRPGRHRPGLLRRLVPPGPRTRPR